MAAKPFPILFIGPDRIGDAVLSSGLIKRLADEMPSARFTIVAGPTAAPLFAEVPGLDALIVMQKRKRSAHWFGLWNKVRHKRWSLVVDMRRSVVARLLRSDRRSLNRKNTSEPTHKVIQAASLLTLDNDPPSPFLFTSEEIEARAVELLDAEGPMAGGRLLVLGGPDDMRYVEPLVRTVSRDRVIDLTGQVDLLTVYAVLRHARLFIGNDSGLMHLAAAAGAPTIGLFGPSDDRLYAPWGPDTRTVRGPREFAQFQAIDPALNQAIGHMMDLPVDTVVEAARELLRVTAGVK